MANERVSIKKLSEITGYSVATISRVINKKGKYSPETEKTVLQAIKEYRYVPNMIAKGLRTNQLPTIGIIVPDITNEYFSTITLAAQMAFFKNNYSAFICNTNENRELEERHIQMLRSQNISGIIFVCCEQFYRGNMDSDIPTVYVDRTPTIVDKSFDPILVQSNNYEGGRLAIRELVDSGCRRIVCIMDTRDISSKVNRMEGVVAELRQSGMEPRIYYAQSMTYKGVYTVVDDLLDREGLNFDGIFCYTDIGAMSAIKALTQRGISVPRAVKVMGFDGISHAEYNTPSISTVYQPMERMGELAAQLVLKILHGEKLEQRKYILPVELIKRSTTKQENIG
ncbi:MAG TPA: LacI family transcriptional regulator [Clostridiales bacterium]|nr:LacI family transcriptional regulator [Clostridiales bacterium]